MTEIISRIASTYSTGDWRKLGDRIRNNPKEISESDYVMLQDLRVAYKEPLAVVFNYLEKIARKVDSECLCTYRVKRIDSIISKLIRLPEMVVSRAEDIAGCRCIVHNLDQVYQVLEKLQKNPSKMPFEIKGGGHDYIQNPKPGGYKSLHVIVALKGDNRRIEIQIRTITQHNWATLVEISDLLFDARIKEYRDIHNPDLYKFHELLSKQNNELSDKEKYQISDIAIKYNYLEKVGTVFKKNYIDVKDYWYHSGLQKQSFFLISTDSTGIPEFEGFIYFEEAESAYFDKYVNNKGNKNIVLTHLNKVTFSKISMAYSNYVLTYNAIIVRILTLLSEAVISSYKRNCISQFVKLYNYFLDVIKLWLGNQLQDIISFNNNIEAKKSEKIQKEWITSIASNTNEINKIFSNMHSKLTFGIFNAMSYFTMKKIYRDFEKSISADR